MIPIFFELGPVKLYSYGLMMALGFWLGTQIASKEFARRGGNADVFWRVAMFAFVAALVTSHLWWWVQEARRGRAGLDQLLSGSGHVWFAGMIGGLLVGWWLTRRYAMDSLTALDSAGLALPLGHGLGRIGCHLAGDGDWGTVTDLPWGVAYEKAIAGWPHPPGVTVHPTPLYEATAYGLIFIALWFTRSRLERGALLGASLMLTSIARFVIEFWRLNPEVALGLSEAQLIAVGLAAIGAHLLLRARRMKPEDARRT